MIRSRGSRGYHSPGCVAPFPHSNRRVSERRKAVVRAGRVSGTSVLAGRKHERTASSHRGKPSGLYIQSYISRIHLPYSTKGIHKPHNRYNTTRHIPYIHSQHNTKNVYKPHNSYSKRKGVPTYHRTVSTHIPYNIPFTRTHDHFRPLHTHTNVRLTTYTQPSQKPLWIPMHGFLVAGRGIEQADGSLGPIPPRVQGQPHKNLTGIRRVDIHSHQQYNKRGSAKTHHRHTRTHTEQALSEGFAFTNPSQDIHTPSGHTYTHTHTRHTVNRWGITYPRSL
jgi:hypothetical protein